MSSHNLVFNHSYLDFDSLSLANYVDSGVNLELNSYRVYHTVTTDIAGFLDNLDFKTFINNFEKSFLKLKDNNFGLIEMEIHLDLDDYDKHLRFLKKLVKHITSFSKNHYQRKNKRVCLYITIHDYDDEDYYVDDALDFLDKCANYFYEFDWNVDC